MAALQFHAMGQQFRIPILGAMPHPAGGPLRFEFTHDAGQLATGNDARVSSGLSGGGGDPLYGCAFLVGGEQQIHGSILLCGGVLWCSWSWCGARPGAGRDCSSTAAAVPGCAHKACRPFVVPAASISVNAMSMRNRRQGQTSKHHGQSSRTPQGGDADGSWVPRDAVGILLVSGDPYLQEEAKRIIAAAGGSLRTAIDVAEAVHGWDNADVVLVGSDIRELPPRGGGLPQFCSAKPLKVTGYGV